MSVTISGWLLMVLTWLLPKFGVNVDANALTTTIATIVQIGGGILVWWGRYRQGDITWYGAKISSPTTTTPAV